MDGWSRWRDEKPASLHHALPLLLRLSRHLTSSGSNLRKMAAAAARCLLVGRALLSPLVPRLDNSRNPAPSPLPSVSASSLFDSSCFPSCKNFTYSRIYAAPPRCSLSDINESNPGQDFALLLEVEGFDSPPRLCFFLINIFRFC